MLNALRRARPVERGCYLVGAALVLSGLGHLVPAVVSPRPWLGPLSWRKPVTFGLSFGTTLVAITWVSSYLRLSPRTRTVLLAVFAIDCIVEVTGISVQAWRDVPSHFNTESALDTVIAMSLAVGGGVLVVVLGSLAATAFRGRIDGDAAMALALKAGFGLLLAGLAAGVAMIARGEVLLRTSTKEHAYDAAGFLKWFHAVTLHAVLVLPLLAWWLARSGRTERQRILAVRAAAGAYVAAAAVALAVSIAVMP